MATRDAISARASSKAVAAVNGEIFDTIAGMEAEEQIAYRPGDDRARRHAEQGRLGANAILGVSLAVAKAAAMHRACRSTAMSAAPRPARCRCR
jgi:enolase